MTIIDTHHHFWKYSAAEYGWISDEMKTIRRDFLPADLKKTLDEAGVSGAVSVQARTTVEESDWLLGMAEKHDFLRGVVGWVPLTENDVEKHLERLAAHKKFKGVRHVIQGEPDDNYILRPDFNAGVKKLLKYKLRYDILIYERHLKPAIRFVDQHPNQLFILDHVAKPKIKERILSPWREDMIALGKRPNVYCKLSGMITEADWKKWSSADLAPYLDTALQAFGPKRLLFGSDWPVMLVAGQYKPWVELIKQTIKRYSVAEQEQILSRNAIAAYGL
ncbi:MAG: amidohydrolase family protein [Acidobacteriaceae bacterium]|jgi:L-fuconolactonase|nr:amidohydrolase family protein [Acidobacteriaceae bacterium]